MVSPQRLGEVRSVSQSKQTPPPGIDRVVQTNLQIPVKVLDAGGVPQDASRSQCFNPVRLDAHRKLCSECSPEKALYLAGVLSNTGRQRSQIDLQASCLVNFGPTSCTLQSDLSGVNPFFGTETILSSRKRNTCSHSRRPVASVQRSVLDRFRNMLDRDCLFPVQIRNGSGDLQNAVMGARA